ncbi:HNH endonuclease [Streptomyces sp. NPDC059849]|uniref:HNH endonuclease n=1 Tax=Streptomyces sp. NPDC059849 TaxID=3346969 RepID=UPI00364FFF93
MGRKRTKFDTWYRLMILMANEGRCVYCDCVKSEVIDHVIPFTLGGADSWENLVPACRECNLQKGDRSVLTWIADRVSRGGWYSNKVVALGSRPHDKQGLEWINGQIDYTFQNVHAILSGAYEEIADPQRKDWFFEGFWMLGKTSWSLTMGRIWVEKEIVEAKENGYSKRTEPSKLHQIPRALL